MIRIGSFAILALGVVWLLVRGLDYGACAWYGHQTERDTRYAAFVGCMVKTSSGWVPQYELRTQQ